ncbi:Ku protein [Massilia sp. Se16.2.3]|uniref:non-homologous end joining protein Ku n=1 Tax=Massilia sp. Se16.2.3 TaxID=2709303 RepID=UPI0016044AAD|nr:Ku protein [Massilia sp. Se16.2.3]QNA99710.1 Ku protein [Massilia sp. Se16.2.3]
MARSMWKGAISFGLVHIPVEMYPAVSDKGLDLHMLDRRDFSPIGFKRYNKNTNAEVSWDDIIKGYEYADGEYVVLSDEDLRRANPEATQTIDILAFVDAEDVPLLYYDQPYYLAPGKGGDKVYALLRDVLKRVGKIGIAHVVIRVKQHLAALVCVGDTIVMNTLRYADEIRDPGELKIPTKDTKNAAVTDKELKMAMALVQGMAEDWEPEQYHDTYREDVLAMIEKKIKARQTKTITMPDPEERPARATNVIDLVSLLQASLGKKPGKAAAVDDEDDDEPPPPKRAPKPAARKGDDDAPAPGKRKAATHAEEEEAVAARARPAAKKPVAGKAAAKKPAAKAVAEKAPARRRKAA